MAHRGDRPGWPAVHAPGPGNVRARASRREVARGAQPLLPLAVAVRVGPPAAVRDPVPVFPLSLPPPPPGGAPPPPGPPPPPSQVRTAPADPGRAPAPV